MENFMSIYTFSPSIHIFLICIGSTKKQPGTDFKWVNIISAS